MRSGDRSEEEKTTNKISSEQQYRARFCDAHKKKSSSDRNGKLVYLKQEIMGREEGKKRHLFISARHHTFFGEKKNDKHEPFSACLKKKKKKAKKKRKKTEKENRTTIQT